MDYILADDFGLPDIGCYGGDIPTPNIDALAKNGTRFTDAYVEQVLVLVEAVPNGADSGSGAGRSDSPPCRAWWWAVR